jgi:transposase
MSRSEVNRLEVIQKTELNIIKRHEAAKQLGISVRQVIRLVKVYRKLGAEGLVSKQRGKPSNHQHHPDTKAQIMQHVKKSYADFGPTLAAEKLSERHQLSVNRETLRQWMIADGLWKGKRRKSVVTHQQRTRRACLGELVQIDGSPHAWFEDRAPKCCLLVFIDDATSRLLQLRFEPQETSWGYMNATRCYIEKMGCPAAFYSDKHSIFRINQPEAQESTGETQFGRITRELGIQLICANSPQAKGRVERANQTLQDRLVKALRLANVSDIKSANAFLPGFMEAYNKRFAVDARNPNNAHSQHLPTQAQLDLLFTLQAQRTLSKNLELSYKNVIYQVQVSGQGYAMRQAKVTVCENEKHEVSLMYKGRLLTYTTLDKKNQPTEPASSKEINHVVDKRLKARKAYKPAADHPWRAYPTAMKAAQKIRTA